jgi:hypothetical protein
MYDTPRMEKLDAREKRMKPFFGFVLRDFNRDELREEFPWKKRVRTGMMP